MKKGIRDDDEVEHPQLTWTFIQVQRNTSYVFQGVYSGYDQWYVGGQVD